MSATFTSLAPDIGKATSARSETSSKARLAKPEEGSRFADDLREARRAARDRRAESDDRSNAADPTSEAAGEPGFKSRVSILALHEGVLDAPSEMPPADAEIQAPVAPAPEPPPVTPAATAAVAPTGGPTEAQIAPAEGEMLAAAAAKPALPAEGHAQPAPKLAMTTEDFVLPSQTDADHSKPEEPAGDVDLFAEQSLKSTSADVQAKAPHGAQAARTMPAVVPLDHVAVHIAKSAAQGIDKIQIQLTPASLGRIDVEMELAHDGRVDAVVRVDKPETMELLQRDARQLVRALQDAGLQADSGSLSFELRDQGGQQQDRAASATTRSANDNDGLGLAGEAVHETPAPTARRVTLGGVDILA